MNRVLSCHLRFTCFERLTLKCWEVSASLDGSEHSLTFSSRSVPRAWATRRAPDSGSAPPRDLPPDFCPGSLCRALPPLLLCWGKGGGEGHRGPWQGEDADQTGGWSDLDPPWWPGCGVTWVTASGSLPPLRIGVLRCLPPRVGRSKGSTSCGHGRCTSVNSKHFIIIKLYFPPLPS